MKYQIEPLYPIKVQHGEGPVWDPSGQQFFWVDLMQGQFFQADWKSRVVESHAVGQPLGVLALREKGGLVMALRDGFYFYDLHSRRLQEVNPVEKRLEATRFNDGAVDPSGRFWAGTMSYEGDQPVGNLYCLGQDHSVRKMEQTVWLANGMGWTTDRKTFYFTDTVQQVIYAYDYDPESGNISNCRDFIRFENGGLPDGMTVDAENGIWVAMWSQGKICRFDPAGKWMENIDLPVSHPTSCCFGGPEMKSLLITSSQRDLSPKQRQEQPLAGRCLLIETEVCGQVEPKFGG